MKKLFLILLTIVSAIFVFILVKQVNFVEKNSSINTITTEVKNYKKQIKKTYTIRKQTTEVQQVSANTNNNPKRSKVETLNFDKTWKYANESKVYDSHVKLYYTSQEKGKGKIICINAGHGSKKSQKVYTYCNPAHKPKFISGSTKSGSNKAIGVSFGTVMLDGTTEAEANLKVALVLKDLLLQKGYHVLMLRETDDVNLDNVARTVFANQYADCHISIHFDGTKTDKGAFCVVPPNIKEYFEIEPISSNWKKHYALANSMLEGFRSNKIKINGNGLLEVDLTQISYSTIPTVALELGDRKSDISSKSVNKLALGIADGLDIYFSKNSK